MITSVEITNLRGIASGRLEGLAPLTILTGPNACGKSTVLDALLIGTSPTPERGVGQAVRRHPMVPAGAPWLFGPAGGKAEIEVESGLAWSCSLELHGLDDDGRREELMRRRSPPPYTRIDVRLSTDANGRRSVSFGGDNQFVIASGEAATASTPEGTWDWPRAGVEDTVRIVDPGLPMSLHRAFSKAAQAGRREEAERLLLGLMAGFQRLEIIALAEQEFSLAVTRDGRSVPVGLSGDGIQALVQLALGLALEPGGLALVEEPETYLHPKAVSQSARALLAAVRRKIQVVLTTHSLELIDALLAEATDADLPRIALFNLALVNGELRSGRRAGEEIRFARATLENDLR